AIFTRARVQADVQRIIQLYRQSGRFAAQVTPKVVEQPQNRVDLVFEISEGPVTGVRRINFVGNQAFRDGRLRREVLTAESRWWRIFSSNDNYDPGRLEYDRELLRDYYTDLGYADFRVVSAVAELTPDQRDFFITYVIDEGQQYEFGDISVSTELDILDPERMRAVVPIQEGTLYRASRIEDAVDSLSFAAGAAGYAFVDVRPRVQRNRDDQTIDIDFAISEGPRVYVERIDIVGNTRTVDNVIRREVQLVEGDAFNRVAINRSRTRIRGLGFFGQVEISEQPGSLPDRAILEVEVEEQPTGELSFGAGFSSIDALLIDLSITERNLRGRGQFLRFRVSASSRRQIIDIRFTEPRFLGRNIAAGVDLFNTRQDFVTEANFETASLGGSVRLGFPVTDNASLGLRYTLRSDEVTTFTGVTSAIDAQEGSRLSSVLGYTIRWDRRNDPIEPTRGFDLALSQDLAGFGGDVRFLRTEVTGATYRGIARDIVASLALDAGYVAEWGGEEIRINDRFFKGGGSFRGFETAGIGPRVVNQVQSTGEINFSGDALGGQFFAIGTAELSFPLGLPEEYGIKGSFFAEAGYLGVNKDSLGPVDPDAVNIDVIRDDLTLRASAGISVFWRSPFGPIRFDFSEVLAREEYDKTESFRFSTSTRF
ncbi:MAG: outer membrane protein assembly factor BamA, partial [Caulobacterales bacterium]|nr:outer membrane protein assembly factor BamA [Caulobacterales bacterium]